MSFPALLDFEDDAGVNTTIWRVYTHLRKHELVLHEPRAVKVTQLAALLRMHHLTVANALAWLTEHQYVLDRGRTGKLRLLMLTYRREVAQLASVRN